MPDGGAPGQAGPKAAEHEVVVRLDPAFADGFIQGQRDRAGGGVSVTGQVVKHLAAGDVQNIDGGIDDANVGLVGNVQVDGAGAQFAILEDVLNRVAQDGDGPAKDGAAVHVHVMQALAQ